MQTEVIGVYTGFAIHKALKLEERLDAYAYGDMMAYRYSIDNHKALGLLPVANTKYAVAHTRFGAISLPITQAEMRKRIEDADGIVFIANNKKKHTVSIIAYYGEFDPEIIAIKVMNAHRAKLSRDNQRKLVYRMDNMYEPRLGYITQKQAREVFDRIIADYEFPRERCEYAIERRFETKQGHAITLPIDYEIPDPLFVIVHLEPTKINGKELVSLELLIHEVAHLLQPHEYGRCVEAHGPEFVTLLGELIIRYARDYGNKYVLTRREYVMECRKRNIRVFAKDIAREK